MGTRMNSGTAISKAAADSLGYQVNITAKAFAAALAARLPKGMTTTQVGLLSYLSEHPGSSQREISDGTGIDTATLAEMLRRLADRGVVRRDPDPADARRVLVSLHELDDSVIRAAIQAAHDVNLLAVQGLSQEEVVTLTTLLQGLRANLA